MKKLLVLSAGLITFCSAANAADNVFTDATEKAFGHNPMRSIRNAEAIMNFVPEPGQYIDLEDVSEATSLNIEEDHDGRYFINGGGHCFPALREHTIKFDAKCQDTTEHVMWKVVHANDGVYLVTTATAQGSTSLNVWKLNNTKP